MVKFIAGLLGGNTLMAWLLVAGLGIGALGGVYWYVDRGGYQRATLEWTVKYNARELALEKQRLAELDRQAQANDTAKAAEAARIAQLRNELAQRERELQEQSHEADIDPNADRIGLGADSVSRIGRVGGPK